MLHTIVLMHVDDVTFSYCNLASAFRAFPLNSVDVGSCEMSEVAKCDGKEYPEAYDDIISCLGKYISR